MALSAGVTLAPQARSAAFPFATHLARVLLRISASMNERRQTGPDRSRLLTHGSQDGALFLRPGRLHRDHPHFTSPFVVLPAPAVAVPPAPEELGAVTAIRSS